MGHARGESIHLVRVYIALWLRTDLLVMCAAQITKWHHFAQWFPRLPVTHNAASPTLLSTHPRHPLHQPQKRCAATERTHRGAQMTTSVVWAQRYVCSMVDFFFCTNYLFSFFLESNLLITTLPTAPRSHDMHQHQHQPTPTTTITDTPPCRPKRRLMSFGP